MGAIDWESDDTLVLMNPKIPTDQRVFLEQELRATGLEGHIWVSTSGSSSTSNLAAKWVALSKKAILTSAEAVNRHIEAQKNDCWICALPGFHVGGIGIHARGHLAGCSVVEYKGKWNPAIFQQACHESQGTLTALVPTQLYDLVQENLAAPSSLRATVIGGGALNKQLYFAAKRLGWNPLPSYGLSECASQVATASLESLNKDGFPELELLTHIEEAALTEDGCLKIRSPSLLTIYAIVDQKSCFLTDPKIEGWLPTEDIATINGRCLTVHGRTTDIVKVGGENVNIEALNQLLSDISAGIQGDQVIVAMPCERKGHEVQMATANTPNDAVNRLVCTFNNQVLPFERIRAVHFIEAIPRTPLNKVKKQLLKKMCQSKTSLSK